MSEPLIITITPVTKRPATDKVQFCVIASGGKHRTQQEQTLQNIRRHLQFTGHVCRQDIGIDKLIMEE